MKRIAIQKFKKTCLAVIDEVHATRESVIITKGGMPVAKLVPVRVDARDIFGFLEGRGRIVGDIISPALALRARGRHPKVQVPLQRENLPGS